MKKSVKKEDNKNILIFSIILAIILIFGFTIINLKITGNAITSKISRVVAYFPFDSNVSSNINSITLSGTMANQNFLNGMSDGALGFSGSNSLNISANPAINFNNNSIFSINVWVKPTSFSSPYTALYFLDKQENIYNEFYYGMGFINGTGQPFFVIGSQMVKAIWAISDTNVSLNEWHMISVSVDGTNINFYVDGKLKKTTPLAITGTNPSIAPLIIGSGFTNQFNFIGLVDELKIWNTYLDPQDVTAEYNAYFPYIICSDPDFYNYYIPGITRNFTSTAGDVCKNSTTLLETICNQTNQNINNIEYNCPNGCGAGACYCGSPRNYLINASVNNTNGFPRTLNIGLFDGMSWTNACLGVGLGTTCNANNLFNLTISQFDDSNNIPNHAYLQLTGNAYSGYLNNFGTIINSSYSNYLYVPLSLAGAANVSISVCNNSSLNVVSPCAVWAAVNTSCNSAGNLTTWYNNTNSSCTNLNGRPANVSYVCNSCANWVAMNTSCQSNDYITAWYNNTNTSCLYPGVTPDNTTYDCDYNRLGVIGNSDSISQENMNISIYIDSVKFNETKNYTTAPSALKKTVKIYDGSVSRLEFKYNFSSPLNLRKIILKKQTSSSSVGYLEIHGLTETIKSVIVDKKSNTSKSVCIKDDESSSQSRISATCIGTNEYLVSCPGTNGNYTCTLSGDKFSVDGLSNSVVKEYLPTTNYTIVPGNNITKCTPRWNCTTWSDCNEATSTQTRICSNDINNCNNISSKPAEMKSCNETCKTNWVCGNWTPSDCKTGTSQTRTCTDKNRCGSIDDKPSTSQTCQTTSISVPWIIIFSVAIGIIILLILIYYLKKKKSQTPQKQPLPARPTNPSGFPPRPGPIIPGQFRAPAPVQNPNWYRQPGMK